MLKLLQKTSASSRDEVYVASTKAMGFHYNSDHLNILQLVKNGPWPVGKLYKLKLFSQCSNYLNAISL